MLFFNNTLKQTNISKKNILFVTAFTIIASGSFTTLSGLLTSNFVSKFGWSTSEIGIGVSINILLYGLAAPFAIEIMKRYGIRFVTTVSLAMMIFGSIAILSKDVLVFNLAWGFLIGLGTGSLTMAYGAYIARNYFPTEKQGFVSGVLTASAVFGQFALLPFWANLVSIHGWYAPLLGSSLIALFAIFLNIFFMPHQSNIEKSTFNSLDNQKEIFSTVMKVFFLVLRSKAFWVLSIIFVICGATTNGLLWSHFIPACTDAGISTINASSVLFLIGIFNVVGTVFSGWLTDRMSPRMILAFVFLARAGTLFWLPLIIVNDFDLKMVTFGIFFGILDVATVPPVIALCNKVFGDNGPSVFAWINAFHQLGAGMMALSGGIIRSSMGDYHFMWLSAAILSGVTAIIAYSDRFDKKYHLTPIKQ